MENSIVAFLQGLFKTPADFYYLLVTTTLAIVLYNVNRTKIRYHQKFLKLTMDYQKQKVVIENMEKDKEDIGKIEKSYREKIDNIVKQYEERFAVERERGDKFKKLAEEQALTIRQEVETIATLVEQLQEKNAPKELPYEHGERLIDLIEEGITREYGVDNEPVPEFQISQLSIFEGRLTIKAALDKEPQQDFIMNVPQVTSDIQKILKEIPKRNVYLGMGGISGECYVIFDRVSTGLEPQEIQSIIDNLSVS